MISKRTALASFALLSLLAFPVPARAQVTTGEQLLSRTGANPTVAADGRNGFVLGWQDTDSPASHGIFAATLPEGARAPRKPFRVNTTTDGFQLLPRVAADANGRFVFVWQNVPTFPDAPPATSRVFGQAFGAGGGRQSAEVLLSPTEVGQLSPRVAMADGGDFLAAWTESLSPRPPIKAALFSAGGVRRGAEIDLDARGLENVLTNVVSYPGGFAVGWTEYYDCHSFDPGGVVGAVARFDSAGRRLGPVFRQGSPACSDSSSTSRNVLYALMGSRAGLLAVFLHLSDSSYYLVQRFTPIGEPTGGQSRIPRPDCSEIGCTFPAAFTMDDSGRFAVLWSSDDANGESLSAQLFNPRGKPLTGRGAVIVEPYGIELIGTAALADDGILAVVFQRLGGEQPARDGLYLRRVALGGKAGE